MSDVIHDRLLGALRSYTFLFALVLGVGLLIANLFVQPGFLASASLPGTLANLAPFGIVAMATAPSVIVGGLDLSVGPVLSLTNVMFVAVLIPAGLGTPWISVPLLLTLGAATGLANGALISYLRFPPVIVGLAALLVVGGISGRILPLPSPAPSNWTDNLGASIGPVPGGLVTMSIPLLLWFILRRTPLVRAIFAVGGDPAASFSAGVNVGMTRVLAYALGGTFAAMAGFALTGLIRSADSTLGFQYTLIATAAVSLGGTPIGGGRGGLLGGLLGAICVYLIENLLSGLHVSAQWLNLVYGVVLIAAVIVGAQLTKNRPAEVAA